MNLLRRTFVRNWPAILSTWLPVTVAACAVAYSSVQPMYRASGLLRVEPTVADMINVQYTGDRLGTYLQTQLQLITSPDVLTTVAANPRVAALERIRKAGDAVLELRKAVSISIVPNTYLIEVAMTSPDASETATIVNAVVGAFMAVSDVSSTSMARQEIKNLEKYQVDLKNQIDELERRWKILAAREDIDFAARIGRQGVPHDREAITIEEYRQTRQQLNLVEMELAQTQAWLTTVQEDARKVAQAEITADKDEWLNRQIERRLSLDPEISKLVGDIDATETELKELNLRRLSSAGDPAIKATYRKLADLGRRHRKLWDDRSQALRERIVLQGRALNPEQEIREAEATINRLLDSRAMLKAKYAKLDVGRDRSANEWLEIALLQDGWKSLKSMRDAVDRRLGQLRRDPGTEVRIRPVKPNGVSVPTQPIPDHRRLIVELIPIVVLFGVVGLFLGVEKRSGSRIARKARPIPEV